jgi:protein-tyrosine phosphatase
MARFEYHWLTSTLAQGSYPDPPERAFEIFDVVAFCAMEHQPRLKLSGGKQKFMLPLDDDPYRPVPDEVGQLLHEAAKRIASYMRGGRRVLSTCHQGMNRSGVISALSLMYAFRFTPGEAISLIRRRRNPEALFNPMFVQWLQNQRVR